MPHPQTPRLPSPRHEHTPPVPATTTNPGAAINRRRTLLITLGAAVLIAAAVLTAIQLHHKPTPPIAYTNISRNFKTCLLTTETNTPIWAEIQHATRNKPINAQHITAPPGTTPTLLPYLNSLLSLHCQLIITAGKTLTGALTTTAEANPHQTFANISPVTTHLTNIHDLSNNSPTAITQLIATACQC